MKITLIQPPKPSYGTEAEQHWSLARPFSLFFLAASLEKYTPYKIKIIDLEHKKYRNTSIENLFKNDNSMIYGITATTFTRFEAINIAKLIKKFNPSALIIVGGVHFMYCATDTLEKVPEIDIVVRGEGEITIVEIAKLFGEGGDFLNIRGITHRVNGEIVTNPDQQIFEDLDSLPFYSKFSWEEYPEYLFGYPERIPAISVMASRGCPFRCIFCAKAGMRYRLRNPKNVVDEIQIFKDKYNIQGINFLDLTFTANHSYTELLCQEIIKRNLNLKFWCESRANIPLQLLDTMKKAGCASLVIGVESGSPRIIKKISKDITIEQVKNFCKKCKDLEIIIQPYFMFSHPDETKEDVEQTIDLILDLEKYTEPCSFQPTMVFPGTEIERIAHDIGLLKKEFSWCYPYHNELNNKIGQLSNIPIFIDKLSGDTLISFYQKLDRKRSFNQNLNIALNMSFKDLAIRWYNSIRLHGLRNLRSRLSFSPIFYYKFINAKLSGKHNF